MAKKQVFYSFHFDNDVMRVQQVRNMGVIEGNTPTAPNQWETVKSNGDVAIKKWIDDNMKYKNCVVVLIGEETANRPWVKYELEKAWKDGRGLLGVHIHNLKCPRMRTSRKGRNPFADFNFGNQKFSDIVPCYDPSPFYAYNEIANNIDSWIDRAIQIRKQYN